MTHDDTIERLAVLIACGLADHRMVEFSSVLIGEADHDEAGRILAVVEGCEYLVTVAPKERGMPAPLTSPAVAGQARTIGRQLRLAHQSRRASEHLLDGIRRALCDAGAMRDDDPYGHADLADVIRQTRGSEPACGYCGCTTPSAERTTCHHGEQAQQAAEVPAALPPTRKLIRDVLGYVSGCVYAMDRDYVEELTDRLWDLYRGPAEETKPPAVPPCDIDHDCPGQVRQPPHCGCAAWDRGEMHPAHQWHSATGGRVSCNGAPPFGTPRRGDRVRVTYEADWDKALSSGGRMVLAGDEPGNRCHNVIPDSATVEVIGRTGGAE